MAQESNCPDPRIRVSKGPQVNLGEFTCFSVVGPTTRLLKSWDILKRPSAPRTLLHPKDVRFPDIERRRTGRARGRAGPTVTVKITNGVTSELSLIVLFQKHVRLKDLDFGTTQLEMT